MGEKNQGRKPFYLSRKFWYVIVATAIPIANRLLKLELSPTDVWQAMAPLLGAFGVEGGIDIVRGHAEAKNGSAPK